MDTEAKQQAAQHWRDLADEQERGAAMGVYQAEVARGNANLYRRTARSIEQGVCVCCGKPYGRGTLHH